MHLVPRDVSNGALITIWGVLTILSIVSIYIPTLSMMSLHGKLASAIKSRWLIPKTWFFHFYIYAVASLCVFRSIAFGVTGLFLFHVLRRLFEEVYFFPNHRPGRRMHTVAYLFSFVYYTAVVFTLGTTVLSFELFWVSSCVQFLVHRDLYLARLSGRVPKNAPKTFWFKYMNCPHYLCEMLIYLSLTSIDDLASVSLLGFVLVSLSVNWRNHSLWYKR